MATSYSRKRKASNDCYNMPPTQFKIILIILSHGSAENICDLSPVDNPMKPYINHINLYSMVPYGVNAASCSRETARNTKHQAIKTNFNMLKTKDFNPNSYGLGSYGITDYDILLNRIISNLSGEFIQQSFNEISAAAFVRGRGDTYPYFKTNFAESKNFIDPQVIVKETYSFNSHEYSGIFGLCASDNDKDIDFKDIDFKDIDFTRIYNVLISIKREDIWNDVISLYIQGWNELNGSDRIVLDDDERITRINTKSLYHIIFLFLNGVMNTPIYDTIKTKIEDGIYSNFHMFLIDVETNLNVDLYLLSFACRGVHGLGGEECKGVNDRLLSEQPRLSCKKQGFETIYNKSSRRHYGGKHNKLIKNKFYNKVKNGQFRGKRTRRKNQNQSNNKKNLRKSKTHKKRKTRRGRK